MLAEKLKQVARFVSAAFAAVLMLAVSTAVLAFGLLLSVSLIIASLVASRFVMPRKSREAADDDVIDLEKGDYHSVVR